MVAQRIRSPAHIPAAFRGLPRPWPGAVHSTTGTGLGALDSFLVDKLVSAPGPYSFLSDTWPSLFTGS